MTSMQHIADKLGLSRTTVSNILNNNFDTYSYRTETIELVKKTALELNYTPNYMARSLKTGESKTLALIVPDICNTFYLKIIKEIENLSVLEDYNLMICITEESLDAEERALQMLRRRMVDGVMISPVSYTDSLRTDYNLLILCFDRYVENSLIPSVSIDNLSTSRILADKIRLDANSRVLFLGGNDQDITNRKRLEGLRQSITIRGMPWPLGIDAVFGVYTEQDAFMAMENQYATGQKYDAVFLTTNHLIHGVIGAIEKLDLPVHTVAGFEDFPARDCIARHLNFRVLIAEQPEIRMARQTYANLRELMTGKKPGDIQLPLDEIIFHDY